MRCHQCGGPFSQRKGSLKLSDDSVGPYTVDNIAYLECDKCKEYLFPYSTAKKIETVCDHKLDGLLKSQPIGEYLTASEAARILGITPQALSKHRRIRRGYIFQLRFGNGVVYLKKSVLLFKKGGDGRFLLGSQESGLLKAKLRATPAPSTCSKTARCRGDETNGS